MPVLLNYWMIFPLVAVVSLLLTGVIRRYALSRNLLDIPNNRSSHAVPTPRAGGLAIVLTFFPGLLALWMIGSLPTKVLFALFGAGSLVTWIGFLDDRRHIPPKWRLGAHFLGAAWGIFWLGDLPPLSVFGHLVHLGWAGYLLAAVYLVWVLNLYNFMDGIDGIAGIEAITVCLGGGIVSALFAPASQEWLVPALLLSAVAGFLCWNFPPAKIFMGDSGSGFLGLTLGLLSIQASQVNPELFWCWLILLGVFIVDATTTLLRRAIRGKAIYEAHCSHAYQHASRRFDAHRPVSVVVGMINLFWLLPVALLVTFGSLPGSTGLLIAYSPLIFCAFLFKAGLEVRQKNISA
ncbi:MraY family glycosyltransferase [Thiovibrio frasassiensis]|uniref:Glycosyltransferase family 4 protein n=1 Tax=Thiovibrio frasassiensis TaxID=2984131 RepID=A0A9X4MIB7_9BACT|nr:glycosyltransferase family 4 protein [Thiovibrio frasassiensis]MDG4476068.1 glycosyltransferase family 4 protein [Thiovibrio frasassiensis]